MLGEQERAAEDDFDLPPPFVERHVEHALLVEDGGVVHQDIDAAEVFERRRDRVDHIALIGDVAGDADGAAADVR